MRGGLVDQGVMAPVISHAQIDVHAIAHSIGERTGHERHVNVVLPRDLAGELAEEKCGVGSGERLLVVQGHLHLRGSELTVDALDLEVALFGSLGNGFQRAGGVRAGTDPVNAMVGHGKLGEGLSSTQEEELHLEAGHRREPTIGPPVTHQRQCAPGIQGQRSAVSKMQEGQST